MSIRILFACLLATVSAEAAEVHDAAKTGDVARLEALMKSDPKVASAVDARGLTPLHHACAGKIDAVRLLLARGAEVNARSANGTTPLYVAARFGQVEIAKLLVAGGADVNAVADGGTPLAQAAYRGGAGLVELLLASGADPKLPDGRGATPLHAAATWNAPDSAKRLLDAGAPVDATDRQGDTPLHATVELGKSTAVAELLIARGASLTARNHAGQTPLAKAIAKKASEIESLLRSKGAVE